MTVLQRALITVTLVAAIGAGIYEVRQASRLRRENQTLQQQQARLAEQAQQLTRQRDDVSNRLAQVAPTTAGKNFAWESVESPDYKQYIANLRAAGCPEETIRDIIRADVHKLYEDKKKEVRQNAPKLQYWKEDAQKFIRGPGRDMWLQTGALEEEQLALLRRLGIEPDYNMQMVKRVNGMNVALDFLSDEKKTEILRLQKAVEDRRAMRKGAEDAEAIMKLQTELEDGVKRLLTPEEALQYQMRLSPTASRMMNFDGQAVFEFTEPEFVAIFKLRKTFDDEFPLMKLLTATDAEGAKRDEAETQLIEQIKQSLGAQRYADYELAQDGKFQEMFRFAEKAKLGVPEAKQLYLLRRQAEEQAAQVRKDQTLTPESRASARESIRQQTEKSIQSVLGEQGWDQFNRPANNSWLNTIYRQPVPQSTAAPRS
jgi:hypothetical protein